MAKMTSGDHHDTPSKLWPTARLSSLFGAGADFNLAHAIRNASHVRVASALMHPGGLDTLLPRSEELRPRVAVLIGVDFHATHPKALQRLLSLAKSTQGRVRAAVCQPSGGNFHPKIIIVDSPSASVAIVGSSNCTSGGYLHNVEANVLVRDPPRRPGGRRPPSCAGLRSSGRSPGPCRKTARAAPTRSRCIAGARSRAPALRRSGGPGTLVPRTPAALRRRRDAWPSRARRRGARRSRGTARRARRRAAGSPRR